MANSGPGSCAALQRRLKITPPLTLIEATNVIEHDAERAP